MTVLPASKITAFSAIVPPVGENPPSPSWVSWRAPAVRPFRERSAQGSGGRQFSLLDPESTIQHRSSRLQRLDGDRSPSARSHLAGRAPHYRPEQPLLCRCRQFAALDQLDERAHHVRITPAVRHLIPKGVARCFGR